MIAQPMRASLLKSLAAVMAGNAVYFLLVLPHVPVAGRHQPFHLDPGLLIDGLLCVAFWGLFDLIGRRPRRR
jgi:hypothetical protein